jgi:hypothetical protein
MVREEVRKEIKDVVGAARSATPRAAEERAPRG